MKLTILLLALVMLYSCNNPPVPPPPVKHGVKLSWVQSTTPGVIYRVYRANTSGGPYTIVTGAASVTTNTYLDATVVSGQTYYYVTRSFKVIESQNSNEFKIAIP